jgi:flagellar motility protein MotE (MotC chaperone)
VIEYFRDLRLLPIAMVASACLLVLLAADLLLGQLSTSTDGDSPRLKDTTVIHATASSMRAAVDRRKDDKRADDKRVGDKRVDDRHGDDKRPDGQRSDDKRSWAQQMFNYPDSKPTPREQGNLSLLPALAPLPRDKSNSEITGAIPAPNAETQKGEGAKEAAQPQQAQTERPNAETSAKGPQDPPPSPNGKVIAMDANSGPSAAERAILEHLQQRRQELEKRARELDIREGLIADAEKRVESKLLQIKENQQQLVVATQKKDEAETARFKGLVTMYENMKPRDAAKIFDRLDVNVLLQVASQMSPRAMSEILALMSPDRAQQLTVELANRAQATPRNPAANLPKIEGRPTGQ